MQSKVLEAQAAQAAQHTTETDKKLVAQLDLAKLAVAEGRSKQAIGSLGPLCQKAETLGLKYMAVQCSLLMSEAMIQGKDYAHARAQLEQALLRSDKLGLQLVSARAHYLLGTLLRSSGQGADAKDHYRQAVRLLDSISKEKGAEKVLQRRDESGCL